MISRVLIIVLAFGAALYRAGQGAWVESGGLFALGFGLLILRVAPKLTWLAVASFVLTAASMLVVFLRQVP